MASAVSDGKVSFTKQLQGSGEFCFSGNTETFAFSLILVKMRLKNYRKNIPFLPSGNPTCQHLCLHVLLEMTPLWCPEVGLQGVSKEELESMFRL